MPSLVILGAGGFLGRAIIENGINLFAIKAVVRQKSTDLSLNSDRVTWYELDLLISQSLDTVFEKDDIVINTAHIPTNSDTDNLHLIDNIIAACIRNNVKRLIHCSTADVVGVVKDAQIDESVVCQPLTKYEQVKFFIEQRVLNSVLDGLSVVILRPTAIIGIGGKNLFKLADGLMNGNRFVNYLRASLFRHRKMHLVSVHNVSAAILHLSSQDNLSNGNIYFISSDDDPDNNFLTIERILLQALGLRPRKIPLLPIPLLFLSMLLKFKGRSGSNLSRIYDSKKLLATNFVAVDSLYNAVNQFGQSVLNK